MTKSRAKQQRHGDDQIRRRSADFPVREWLKVGAASAGMGAALLGFSLMGPSTGTASADATGDSSSQSTSSAGSDAPSGKPGKSTGSASSESSDDSGTPGGGGTDTDSDADTDADTDADNEAADADSDDIDVAPSAPSGGSAAGADEEDELAEASSEVAEGDSGTLKPTKANLVVAPPVDTTDEEAPDEEEVQPPAPPAPAPASLLPRKTWSDISTEIIDRWTDTYVARIKEMDVSDEAKARLEASFRAFRRTFLNVAPTLDPVQVEGLQGGDISGSINGEDAENDQLIYRLAVRPKYGTVELDEYGGYTYTPGEGFDGVDTFRVMAIDAGFHLNLLNPFRGIGASAYNIINQNAIKFAFTYTGAEWTDERRQKLEEVAANLQEYFRVNKAVTLTYDVNLDSNPRNLASAGSDYISEEAGFWHTVVQHKLLTGVDANGDDTDGEISWNWTDNEWSLTDEIGEGEYDFTSVAVHELMHSFGFLSTLNEAGDNTGSVRSTFDQFIVDSKGRKVFRGVRWSTANDPKLTGGDGGLYFGGSNAIEGYDDNLVPLYTPWTWSGGSSVSHLDDLTFTAPNRTIMNAGDLPGILAGRDFTDFEIGILEDIGYTMVQPENPPYAVDQDEDEDDSEEEAADEPARPPAPAPASLSPRRTWDEVVAQVIDSISERNQAWIDSLDVADERKAELEASFASFRKAFLNQAPTIDPVQITGALSGSITGAVNAEDADGDEIVYRLVSGPRRGSVELNDDGTYTYTPGANFDGVDTFRVVAIDRGLHVNLLNPLRGIGTRAVNLVNQNAITFDFTFDGEDWTLERQQALKDSAASLQAYFRVDRPVTLTFNVKINTDEDALASAGSDYISKLPGYYRTVVQEKLLTGRDANGDKADGEIDWNFSDYEWSLDDEFEGEEYDFVSTAIHELMHSFGFLSSLNDPEDDGAVGANRAVFDRNIVNVRGNKVLYGGEWATVNDPKLIGDDGALYFGGRHAVEANGGFLVPLFTPDPYQSGSSMSHLDDYTFTGVNQKVMNAATDWGLAARVFSELELAILRDLGYTVVMPETPPYSES